MPPTRSHCHYRNDSNTSRVKRAAAAGGGDGGAGDDKVGEPQQKLSLQAERCGDGHLLYTYR